MEHGEEEQVHSPGPVPWDLCIVAQSCPARSWGSPSPRERAGGPGPRLPGVQGLGLPGFQQSFCPDPWIWRILSLRVLSLLLAGLFGWFRLNHFIAVTWSWRVSNTEALPVQQSVSHMYTLTSLRESSCRCCHPRCLLLDMHAGPFFSHFGNKDGAGEENHKEVGV